jgi:hypothetical protein
MKALSIKQPYAGLIMAGIKTIENRSWTTKYTGKLVICSTATPEAKRWFDETREKVKRLGLTFPESGCAINGAALGTVEFNHLVWLDDGGNPVTDSPTLETADCQDWWDDEMIGWIFTNPKPFAKPIPVKGALGLWNFNP